MPVDKNHPEIRRIPLPKIFRKTEGPAPTEANPSEQQSPPRPNPNSVGAAGRVPQGEHVRPQGPTGVPPVAPMAPSPKAAGGTVGVPQAVPPRPTQVVAVPIPSAGPIPQKPILAFERQKIPLITKGSLEGSKHCVLLRVRGTIDIATHQLFENTLSELLEESSTRVILNLADLKYISSSGIGILIKYYKKYVESDGNIKLSSLPSHIEKVLDLIGMNNVIEIFNNDKDALTSFRDNESYKEAAVVEYPAKTTCPSCKAVLEIAKPAKYRCQYCNTYFDAQKSGKIKAFPSPKTRIVEIKLSDQPDSPLWLVSLVKSQCQWLGFSTKEAEEFGDAFREIWQLCTANKKHPWHTFRVTLLIEVGDGGDPAHPVGSEKQDKQSALTVGITSFEKLGVSPNELVKPSIRQKVTNIEILPLLPEGEVIKITKTR